MPAPFSFNQTGYSPSSISQEINPGTSNLLMAAADLHQTGALTSFKQPNPVKPHSPKKKLKVIK